MTGQDVSSTSTSFTELTPGDQVSGSLAEPTQTNRYRFPVQAGTPAVLTFTGPWQEYAIKAYLSIIDKGSAYAHLPEPELNTLTYTFNLDEDNEVLIEIAAADPALLPSSGYTLHLEVSAA